MQTADWELYRTLSLNLLFTRKGLGLDQATFAKRCGLSRYQYIRAEAGHGSITLQTLFKICQTYKLELVSLFQDPFKDSLRLEPRTKIHLQSLNQDNVLKNQILEEKYVSRHNKNIDIRKITLGEKQIRRMRLADRTKIEFLVLKGELTLIFSSEQKNLSAGEQLSLDYDPQLSFEKKPSEFFKLGSIRGAEVLLIQTLVH